MNKIHELAQLAHEAGEPLVGWGKRDSQRGKVYAAEHKTLARVNEFNDKMTRDEIVALVRRIENDPYVVHAYGSVRREIVTSPRRKRNGVAFGSKRIELPPFTHKAWYVIHEVAHGYTPMDNGGHGWLFCYVYLDLLRRFLAPEAADLMVMALRTEGAKYKPPRRKRQVSEANRQAAAERMRAYHAAKVEEEPLYIMTRIKDDQWAFVRDLRLSGGLVFTNHPQDAKVYKTQAGADKFMWKAVTARTASGLAPREFRAVKLSQLQRATG